MLINSYELEVHWEAGCCSQWQTANATLQDDIRQALPNLVSTIEGAKYLPVRQTLSLVKDKRNIEITPQMIHIPYVQSSDEARELVEWVKDLLNRIYSESETAVAAKS